MASTAAILCIIIDRLRLTSETPALLPPSVAVVALGTAPPRNGGDTQGLATTNAPAGAATIARDESVNFMFVLRLVAFEALESRDW